MNATPTVSPAGLIDWHDLEIGGMPAFERALRALESAYLELADRHAAHLAEHHAAAPASELVALVRIRLGDLRYRPFDELLAAALSGEES